MSSELQNYYNNFVATYQSNCDEDPAKCLCGGTGWVLSEVDTYHPCPYHKGPHPDDLDNRGGKPWDTGMVKLYNRWIYLQGEPGEMGGVVWEENQEGRERRLLEVHGPVGELVEELIARLYEDQLTIRELKEQLESWTER